LVSEQVAAPPVPHVVPVQLHAPVVHTSPCRQLLLQLPQWEGSLFGLVQVAPPQTTSPAGHEHTPATHESPVAHAWPHAPQLLGLVATLTQPIRGPQFTSPAGHWHTPAVQTAPAAQR
jgi:hypothetical protein